MKQKKGWRFPSNLKKRNVRAGYIYPDGIVLAEERTLGRGKVKSKVAVYHVYPVAIPARVSIYDGSGSCQSERGELASIVVFNPGILRDGLVSLEISVNSLSPKMVELGGPSLLGNVSIRYRTLSGAQHITTEWPWMSTATQVRFVNFRSPTDDFGRVPLEAGSIQDWADRQCDNDETVIVYE